MSNPSWPDLPRLTRTYIIALSLTAILATFVFIAGLMIVRIERAASEIINLSGRQRMLTQRIHAYGIRMLEGDQEQRDRADKILNDAASKLISTHQMLMTTPKADMLFLLQDQTNTELYTSGPSYIDNQIKELLDIINAIRLATSLDNAQREILLERLEKQTEILLPALDHIVSVYEHSSRNITLLAEYLTFTALASILLLLIGEGVFLFRPMVGNIQKFKEQVLLQAEELQKRTKEIEKSNTKLLYEIELRKQAEKNQRQNNAYLVSLLNASTEISIIATDLNGTIQVFNRGAEALLGYTAQEVIGINNPTIFHDPTEIMEREHEILNITGETPTGIDVFVSKTNIGEHDTREWIYITKDGKHLNVRLTVTGIYNIDKERIGYLGVAIDITDRIQMEKSLQHSEHLFRMFVEHTPAAVAMFDTEVRYLAASQRWYKDYGLEGKNIIGKSHYEIFPEIPLRWKRIHQRVLAGEPLRTDEDSFERLDGSMEWLRWDVRPWRDEDGQIGGIIMFTEVITERKIMQNDLKRTKEEAERANAAKSQFLTRMSHEIRTPLNAILGLSHLAHTPATESNLNDYLNKIESAGTNLLQIVNDVFDFSRIESGSLQLEIQNFDFNDVLHAIQSRFEPAARAKGVNFKIETGPNVPNELRGDPSRLLQILSNLVDNAVKFTHQGEIHISTQEEERQKDMVRLRITITDTGIGFHTDTLEHLFSPFVQADESTTRTHEGAGLGLSISRDLARLMSGDINAVSTVGAGSAFTVTVKLGIATQSLQKHNTNNAQLTAIAGAKILLVEDNAINLQIAKELLLRHNLIVDTASNGKEAVAAVQKKHYDLVLMDIQMPVMDGLEATKAIRALPNTETLSIVAMTAHNLQYDQNQSKKSGMNGHLTKPIDREMLEATLVKFISPLTHTPSFKETSPPVFQYNDEKPTDAPLNTQKIPTFLTLDIAGALNRTANNVGLYTKLLSEFAVEFEDTAKLLHDKIKSDQKENITRAIALAHSLKGVAGNLGIKDVHRDAATFERALDANDIASAETALEKLSSSIPLALTDIAIYLEAVRPNPAPATSDSPLEIEAASLLLEKLHKELLANQLDSVDTVAELKTTLGRPELISTLTNLEQAANNFDFQQAHYHLATLTRALGLCVSMEKVCTIDSTD